MLVVCWTVGAWSGAEIFFRRQGLAASSCLAFCCQLNVTVIELNRRFAYRNTKQSLRGGIHEIDLHFQIGVFTALSNRR
jgi:hypothetical protein